MDSKSQSAVEYLLIIAVALGLIVPTTYLFFKFTSKSNDEIMDSQLTQIGNTIMDTAETVFFSGESAKIVLEFNMPEKVLEVKVLRSRELVFKVLSESGEGELVFFSPSNIPLVTDDPAPECVSGVQCNLLGLESGGLKKIKIEAFVNPAEITQVMISKV